MEATSLACCSAARASCLDSFFGRNTFSLRSKTKSRMIILGWAILSVLRVGVAKTGQAIRHWRQPVMATTTDILQAPGKSGAPEKDSWSAPGATEPAGKSGAPRKDSRSAPTPREPLWRRVGAQMCQFLVPGPGTELPAVPAATAQLPGGSRAAVCGQPHSGGHRQSGPLCQQSVS